ncbi:DUF6965 family protein [Chitinophaga sp.]|uniref:DUF6965 family protein n=1 Tax=Chitinophaga sp. TaxID=1869181 RepID=UPI0039C85C5F
MEKWNIDELEAYFKSVTLPTEINLDQSQRVTNLKNFLDTHFSICRLHNGHSTYHGFYLRLLQAKGVIEKTVNAIHTLDDSNTPGITL